MQSSLFAEEEKKEIINKVKKSQSSCMYSLSQKTLHCPYKFLFVFPYCSRSALLHGKEETRHLPHCLETDC